MCTLDKGWKSSSATLLSQWLLTPLAVSVKLTLVVLINNAKWTGFSLAYEKMLNMIYDFL